MTTYVGTLGNDVLSSGGYSTYYGLDGNDAIVATGPAFNTIEGGEGLDYLVVSSNLSTSRGILYGGDGSDSLFGYQNSDTLYGGEGDDFIAGGHISGNISGFINPIPFSTTGGDYLDGGNGVDALYGFDGNDQLYGGNGNDSNATIISVPGSSYWADGIASTVRAGLYGGDGTDYLDGGQGDDYLEGGQDGDTLLGGTGNDLVYGDNANGSGVGGVDWIEGGDGNDELAGQGGNDVVFGGVGNDSIYGGTGFDVLYGGLGGDNFYIDAPADGFDFIGDFSAAQSDLLVFTSANFGGLNNATIASHFYSGAGFAGFAVAGPYFAYDTNSGNLWYNTPGDPTLVAQLTVPNLSSSSMFFS